MQDTPNFFQCLNCGEFRSSENDDHFAECTGITCRKCKRTFTGPENYNEHLVFGCAPKRYAAPQTIIMPAKNKSKSRQGHKMKRTCPYCLQTMSQNEYYREHKQKCFGIVCMACKTTVPITLFDRHSMICRTNFSKNPYSSYQKKDIEDILADDERISTENDKTPEYDSAKRRKSYQTKKRSLEASELETELTLQLSQDNNDDDISDKIKTTVARVQTILDPLDPETRHCVEYALNLVPLEVIGGLIEKIRNHDVSRRILASLIPETPGPLVKKFIMRSFDSIGVSRFRVQTAISDREKLQNGPDCPDLRKKRIETLTDDEKEALVKIWYASSTPVVGKQSMMIIDPLKCTPLHKRFYDQYGAFYEEKKIGQKSAQIMRVQKYVLCKSLPEIYAEVNEISSKFTPYLINKVRPKNIITRSSDHFWQHQCLCSSCTNAEASTVHLNQIIRENLPQESRSSHKWITVSSILEKTVCGTNSFENIMCADSKKYSSCFAHSTQQNGCVKCHHKCSSKSVEEAINDLLKNVQTTGKIYRLPHFRSDKKAHGNTLWIPRGSEECMMDFRRAKEFCIQSLSEIQAHWFDKVHAKENKIICRAGDVEIDRKFIYVEFDYGRSFTLLPSMRTQGQYLNTRPIAPLTYLFTIFDDLTESWRRFVIHGISQKKSTSHIKDLETIAFRKASDEGIDIADKHIVICSDNSGSEFKNKYSLAMLRNLRSSTIRFKAPAHGKIR
ncbi:Oidioi.mRNA.OKI2018_I69.chr2.g5202.t1.cds [Oikopleura dioica]|uniref:Oidioi.mRNA.OKI2018_I69.chr2.g5202.t1.cds n=1 Tax=Oikopleura dioica TaxID=34765 RepID=A0ABN7T1C2_OIKDI|nr:Oidioi.mRNA.OKI2018_I69.chr2.g5202.t1.cds [Oikopleura dioica]